MIPRTERARPIAGPALALFILAFAASMQACSQTARDPVADGELAAPPESVFLEGRLGSRTIAVEIADEPAEQTKGLMDRMYLAPDRGMLFVYPDEAERHFWMHNTHISLDMIFLDGNRFIVGIIRRAKPDSDDALTIGKPARYVLEVEAGLCDRLGIREGDRLTFR